MIISNSTSLQELFDYAVLSFGEVKPDEVFLVKDLFRGFEWNRIHVGNRTKLGSMFFNLAQKESSSNIKILDKTPQNQQKYRKI